MAHLRSVFGGWAAAAIHTEAIRGYQKQRRLAGAAAATINRETSALSRMFHLAVRAGQWPRRPVFPDRLVENGPRQGFFEHAEYVAVRQHLPPPYQDVLDFAYYSGWRKREMLELEWRDIDAAGGVVRLSPARSKTRQGRVLPISAPIHQVLTQRRPEVPRVFHRDGVTVRGWPRRCCRIDRSGGAFRSGEPSPTDAVGRGPTEFGHPIQHVAREERLGLSSGFRAGSQTRSDDRLVPKDHVLHACLPRVSGGFLQRWTPSFGQVFVTAKVESGS